MTPGTPQRAHFRLIIHAQLQAAQVKVGEYIRRIGFDNFVKMKYIVNSDPC